MNSLSKNIVSSQLSNCDAYTEKPEYGEFLFNGFIKLFDSYPLLADVHREFGSDQKLRILCYQLPEYPSLIEAFQTTASHQPAFLERSLFSSWLCFLMAGRLNLSVAVIKELFIAGLIQDIAANGADHLVAISPIFSSDAGSLNDRQQNHHHAVMTSRFLESVPRLPEGVKVLVRSHHEQFDGSGSPDGKVEQQLSLPQQVLIVANEAMTLCNRDSVTPYNLSAILPIVKLNASVYFRPVFNALISVITATHSSSNLPQSQSVVTSDVLDKQNQLMLRWPHLLKATAEVSLLNDHSTVITLTQIARRAWMLVTTAGILSDDISVWLSQLDSKEGGEDGTEVLLELDILLDELNTMILSYQQHLEGLTQDLSVEMSESKRASLVDLSYSIGEQLETFDLDEFTILNMCD